MSCGLSFVSEINEKEAANQHVGITLIHKAVVMATLSTLVGLIALIIGGWTASRLFRNYQQKVNIIRFHTWLMAAGVGQISDAPSTKRFDAVAYCETAKSEGFLICSDVEDLVILSDLYRRILDSIESAGLCTFPYLKSDFMDYMSLSQQGDVLYPDKKLTKILEHAQSERLVFLVEVKTEQPPSYNSGGKLNSIYFGSSFLEEIEDLLNDRGSITALEYAESTISSKAHFDIVTQAEIVQAALEQLCRDGKAIKSTENYTEFSFSTVYLSNALYEQLYGNQRSERPSC